MPLSVSQKLQAKKHMNVWPNDTTIDASIAALEDGSAKESELTTAIASCETAYTAITTAETASDELTQGGGAAFNHPLNIQTKKLAYRRSQENLARLLGVDLEVMLSTGNSWRVI